MTPDPTFDTPFFRGHPTREVVTITDHRGQPRDYTFPTFFAETEATMIILSADARRCRDLLGDIPFKPVLTHPGRCLFAIAAFRYGRVSDGMVGYNEVAFGVGVSDSWIPLLPAAARRFWGSFGVWVLALPVDSLENCRRGTEIWGLPKTMKTFATSEHDGAHHVSIHDGDALCFRMSTPAGGRKGPITEENRALATRDGRYFRSRTVMAGEGEQYTRLSALSAGFSMEFGDVAPYRQFRELDLGPRPLLVRHFKRLSSALYAPTDVTPAAR